MGPGAHAFDGALTRRWNAARLDRYLAALLPGDGSPARPAAGWHRSPIDPPTAHAEAAILALRLASGLDASAHRRIPELGAGCVGARARDLFAQSTTGWCSRRAAACSPTRSSRDCCRTTACRESRVGRHAPARRSGWYRRVMSQTTTDAHPQAAPAARRATPSRSSRPRRPGRTAPSCCVPSPALEGWGLTVRLGDARQRPPRLSGRPRRGSRRGPQRRVPGPGDRGHHLPPGWLRHRHGCCRCSTARPSPRTPSRCAATRTSPRSTSPSRHGASRAPSRSTPTARRASGAAETTDFSRAHDASRPVLRRGVRPHPARTPTTRTSGPSPAARRAAGSPAAASTWSRRRWARPSRSTPRTGSSISRTWTCDTYQLDGGLTHLRNAGKLEAAAGIVIGELHRVGLARGPRVVHAGHEHRGRPGGGHRAARRALHLRPAHRPRQAPRDRAARRDGHPRCGRRARSSVDEVVTAD